MAGVALLEAAAQRDKRARWKWRRMVWAGTSDLASAAAAFESDCAYKQT